MKIILLEDVRKQGKKGDILEVKDGYGNFLIKNKQATVANTAGLNRLQRENDAKKAQEMEDIKKKEKLKGQLEKLELTFKVKTGAGDKVFGSVSPKQIADALKEKNLSIDKKQIKIADSLSALGYHEVEIELHKKVNAIIKVQLTK